MDAGDQRNPDSTGRPEPVGASQVRSHAASAMTDAGPVKPAYSKQRAPWHRRQFFGRPLRARPTYAVPTGCRRLYVPFHGYMDIGDEERSRVDRFFHVPMLVLALLVLPLLVLDYYVNYRYTGTYQEAFTIAMDIGMGLIWAAFLVEFIIKIGIAQSRLQYATRNWLDVVIIILPFLRPFRGLRVVRVAQVSRAFTLRGVVTKLLRTLIALVLSLEFVVRIRDRFRKPTAEPTAADYRHWPRAALLAEIDRLKARVRELERRQVAPSDKPPAKPSS